MDTADIRRILDPRNRAAGFAQWKSEQSEAQTGAREADRTFVGVDPAAGCGDATSLAGLRQDQAGFFWYRSGDFPVPSELYGGPNRSNTDLSDTHRQEIYGSWVDGARSWSEAMRDTDWLAKFDRVALHFISCFGSCHFYESKKSFRDPDRFLAYMKQKIETRGRVEKMTSIRLCMDL